MYLDKFKENSKPTVAHPQRELKSLVTATIQVEEERKGFINYETFWRWGFDVWAKELVF